MKKKLPNLQENGFQLESGIKLHEEAPKTFWIPTEEQKKNVHKGSIVKLCFEIQTINTEGEAKSEFERMWVIVADRNGDWFTGILDNQPYCTNEMQPGLVFEFNTEHIININDMSVDLGDEKYVEYRAALKTALEQK